MYRRTGAARSEKIAGTVEMNKRKGWGEQLPHHLPFPVFGSLRRGRKGEKKKKKRERKKKTEERKERDRVDAWSAPPELTWRGGKKGRGKRGKVPSRATNCTLWPFMLQLRKGEAKGKKKRREKGFRYSAPGHPESRRPEGRKWSRVPSLSRQDLAQEGKRGGGGERKNPPLRSISGRDIREGGIKVRHYPSANPERRFKEGEKKKGKKGKKGGRDALGCGDVTPRVSLRANEKGQKEAAAARV